MAARAMWKGIVRFGDVAVPVKLYSALEDRSVHFRLLHETDLVPVKQELTNPETGEVVPYDETKRGFVTDEKAMVVLEPDELEEAEPEASRDITILHFLPPDAIDHRWYNRPYWLGPDGSEDAYAALIAALDRKGREGLARWTMRNKQYMGMLRLHQGYPMLMTLRNEHQVVAADALPEPKGPDLDERELAMAKQLMEMLAAPFEPDAYEDAYRDRVMEMIVAKAEGGTVQVGKPRKETRYEDLDEALRASLESIRA